MTWKLLVNKVPVNKVGSDRCGQEKQAAWILVFVLMLLDENVTDNTQKNEQ